MLMVENLLNRGIYCQTNWAKSKYRTVESKDVWIVYVQIDDQAYWDLFKIQFIYLQIRDWNQAIGLLLSNRKW